MNLVIDDDDGAAGLSRRRLDRNSLDTVAARYFGGKRDTGETQADRVQQRAVGLLSRGRACARYDMRVVHPLEWVRRNPRARRVREEVEATLLDCRARGAHESREEAWSERHGVMVDGVMGMK